MLELRAMNKQRGRLRPVLHKGLHKHQPWDFKMPRDLVAEREKAKEHDRMYRLRNFIGEMDTVTL